MGARALARWAVDVAVEQGGAEQCPASCAQARGLGQLSSHVWCDHVMMPGGWGRCAAHLRGRG